MQPPQPSQQVKSMRRNEAGSLATATTAELVARSRGGETAAFGELVARYQAGAVGLARYHVGGADDARDIAQEAFLAAYLHLADLDEPTRFGGWLSRIVVNRFLHWRRRRRARLSEVPLDAPAARRVPAPESQTPEAAAERAEAGDLLRQALAQLPAAQRVVLSLYHLEYLPYRQIADTLDLPVSTVKGRIQQGHRRLRVVLGAPVNRRPAAYRRHAPLAPKSPALQEAVMDQVELLEELMVRHSGAGTHDGLVVLRSRTRERNVAVALSAVDAVAARPRSTPSSPPLPPGTGLLIQTRTVGAAAPPAEGEEPGTVRVQDFRFFTDVLSKLSVRVTSVVLGVAPAADTESTSTPAEPGTAVHFSTPVGEVSVPAPLGYGLALAAAADAPLFGTPALVDAGRAAAPGYAVPDAARAAAAAEQADTTLRLGGALARAAERVRQCGRQDDSFRVRLVPRGGLLDVVAEDGEVLASLGSLKLGFADLSAPADAGEAPRTPAAGYATISGVGRFALLVTPGLTETTLELTAEDAGPPRNA